MLAAYLDTELMPEAAAQMKALLDDTTIKGHAGRDLPDLSSERYAELLCAAKEVIRRKEAAPPMTEAEIIESGVRFICDCPLGD